MECGTTLGSPQDAITFPLQIEHDDRRRLLGRLGFLRCDVATIHHHDMVVRIRTNAPELACDPAFRQRFGP